MGCMLGKNWDLACQLNGELTGRKRDWAQYEDVPEFLAVSVDREGCVWELRRMHYLTSAVVRVIYRVTTPHPNLW
jgi:hypothetical protein